MSAGKKHTFTKTISNRFYVKESPNPTFYAIADQSINIEKQEPHFH